MLTYNTQLKKLVLPEYGRNIQRMIDHCLTLVNRDERNACAHSIIKAMNVLFPSQGNQEEYRRKLWDHLAIMSDFQLDIDWPYEMILPESLDVRPEPLARPYREVPHKMYGKVLLDMIETASQMEDGPEREALAILLASQMKKLLSISGDGVDDTRVFHDLRNLSHGVFNLDPEKVKLPQYKALPAPSKKKKKK